MDVWRFAVTGWVFCEWTFVQIGVVYSMERRLGKIDKTTTNADEASLVIRDERRVPGNARE